MQIHRHITNLIHSLPIHRMDRSQTCIHQRTKRFMHATFNIAAAAHPSPSTPNPFASPSSLRPSCQTKQEAQTWIERVYGKEMWKRMYAPARGGEFLHITSMFLPRNEPGIPSNELYTLRVGDGHPSHPIDRFALSFSRLISQTVIYTGKILRSEPNLRCVYDEPLDPGFRQIRQEFGILPLPDITICKSNYIIDMTHPIFHVPGQHHQLVFHDRGFKELWTQNTFSPNEQWTHGFFTHRSIEAGPTITNAIYELQRKDRTEKPIMKTILLSIFSDASITPDLYRHHLVYPGGTPDSALLPPPSMTLEYLHRWYELKSKFVDDEDPRWQFCWFERKE